MALRRAKSQRTKRAGNAGLIASIAIAFAGVGVGAVAAYLSKHYAAAEAARTSALHASLRDDAAFDEGWRARAELVRLVLEGRPPERLPPPQTRHHRLRPRPRVVIIFDDMGIDKPAFERVLNLPGPVTLSLLPYADDVAALADRARERGREIMLHLPMEPAGEADPGPNALRGDMTGTDFIKALEWNLARFEGYAGVNNHMGSKLTADEAAMKTVLGYVQREGLFFVDSVTTGMTVTRAAGAMVGAEVFSRDVFLDAETSSVAEIKERLRQVERIALETGYAVAICHPYEATIDALGPWLASAPFRGFELVFASALRDIEKPVTPVVAARPDLRT